MYLFRGQLVTERRMVSDLYVFDLETFSWERIQAFPEDDVPKLRYFYSADAWNNQLIIFGGMSNQPDLPNPDELLPNWEVLIRRQQLTPSQALRVRLKLLQIPMSGNDSDLESAHEAVGQESTQRSGIDEEACSKFWNVYIEETQKYDEALLEGWREDMAGMLYLVLQSSLYSASLTAFLFESYQTLQEDPAATTVVLLQRISEQLTPGSNGAPVTSLMTFHPPAAALACNIMWFLSLALALTCSLLATFMQQWT
ncbi:hypothetical protein D9758_014613 [Tetrapyrgos nigripes]|uniref:DUF6535 domain-containing protein n=1 Tax=Tetrapyrgos nigripes TaxID=182062 RepID=A0A8H5CYE6_9AGAR|nr:hypothetical protein D9758_014613 [Tetrapyrgos nigripes]